MSVREAGIRPSSESWPERPGAEEMQAKPTVWEAQPESTSGQGAMSGSN
jgi:hypothetical protein